MTLKQAKTLRLGQVIHHNSEKNSDGSCRRWKVNGVVKTWKTMPGRISVPLKFGLYESNRLTEANIDLFHLENDCNNIKK